MDADQAERDLASHFESEVSERRLQILHNTRAQPSAVPLGRVQTMTVRVGTEEKLRLCCLDAVSAWKF